jgi:serine/threonine protein kinase
MRDVIAEEGGLDPERAARIIAQVASALDVAHAAGLVHRDVKPANILLTPEDHAYLTDFGLSKRLQSESDQTETGHLLGTLNYLAPEQIRAEGVESRTDVYALGCVLYHALTGRVPFEMEDREAKLWAHLSSMPPPVPAGVPEHFDAVISRAMAKAPADRFATAGALAEAATAAARGAPKPTPPPAPTEGAPVATQAMGPPAPATPQPVATQPMPPPWDAGTAASFERRALIAHALRSPFSLIVLVGTLAAGFAFDVIPEAIPVAALVYAAAVAVVYFDRDVRGEILSPGDRADGP